MGRVIAVLNQKGGVGKTTTTMNLGAALAERGLHTLLVDLDPQAALSGGFGLNPDSLDTTIYTVFSDREVPITATLHNVRPNLDLIPCNIDLAAAEVELVAAFSREYFLKRALRPVKDEYAYILIDCGPSLGLLSINALTACDEVLVPVVCEFLSMRAIGMLMDILTRIKKRLNPSLRVLGILPTMHDDRTAHTRNMLNDLHTFFGAKVYDVVIKKAIRLAEAPSVYQTILEYDSDHPGAQAYRKLAEVIDNGQG